MRQYIRYYFQKRIVNLTKTKKADMRQFCLHFLWNIMKNPKQQQNVASAISTSPEETVTVTYGIECGMEDDAEELSDQ